MLEGFHYRKGIVAIPHNPELETVYLLPDRGMNAGKSEAIFGRRPLYLSLLKPSMGAEFPGGGIKFEDEGHGQTFDRKMFTRYAAARREIKEETRSQKGLDDGLDVDNTQLWDMGPSFLVLQIRKNKLCLFSASVVLWFLSDIQENWLIEKNNAIMLNRDQIVKSAYDIPVRPRDRYIIKNYAREQILSQL